MAAIFGLAVIALLLIASESFSLQSSARCLRRTNLLSRTTSIVKKIDVSTTSLLATTDTDSNEEGPFDLAAWFNPNTRGGVIVWSMLLLIVPVGINNYLVSTGLESTKVGAWVGFSFVVLSMVGWASTYLFRVANKDMTYARQLKEYENAVLQKRLEELADDEIDALMEEIDKEEEAQNPTKPAIEAMSEL
jgi:hypothetical protein